MVSGTEKKPIKIGDLQKAVSDNPDSAVAHMRLGTAWLQAGAAKKAEMALRRAVEIDPEYDEAWVNLGGIMLGSWDFSGCVEVNRQVTERNPELLLAHYNQGLGHLYLREAKEMIACFRRVLEIDPEHAAGQYHLAVGGSHRPRPGGRTGALPGTRIPEGAGAQGQECRMSPRKQNFRRSE